MLRFNMTQTGAWMHALWNTAHFTIWASAVLSKQNALCHERALLCNILKDLKSTEKQQQYCSFNLCWAEHLGQNHYKCPLMSGRLQWPKSDHRQTARQRNHCLRSVDPLYECSPVWEPCGAPETLTRWLPSLSICLRTPLSSDGDACLYPECLY